MTLETIGSPAIRLRLGCRLTFKLSAPAPMIFLLNVHYSRASDLEKPDLLVTDPAVSNDMYRDSFGNWCNRLLVPSGVTAVSTDGIIRDAGLSDPIDESAQQQLVQNLPSDVLQYLLPSRYCEVDLLSDFAWECFGSVPEGWLRVQAVCDWVHNHVHFGYENSRATRSASETLNEAAGVCRDFAHLAITLCRGLIPADIIHNRCAQSRIPIDMIVHGCSISLFQARQQVSIMCSLDVNTRFESQFSRMNCQMFSTGLSSGDRGGRGTSVMLAGMSSLCDVCQPA